MAEITQVISTPTGLPPPPDPNVPATFDSLAYPYTVAQREFGIDMGGIATELNTFATQANAVRDEVNSLNTDAQNAKTAAEAAAQLAVDTVATIPEGTINDNLISLTDTWSSAKIAANVPKPVFTTDAVTGISGTTVTLNGTISDFGDASSSLQYRFIYGSTTAMEEGATAWTTASSIGAISASATVALLTTTYYVLMQVRDTNKPDSMGTLPDISAWATERTSFLSGSEVLDPDSYIYLQGTGGTGYSALDGTTVPSVTNGSIINNEVVLSGTGKAITYSINQDGDEGDFSAITPSFKARPYKFGIDSTSTNTTPVLTAGYSGLLTNGSKVIVADGGTDKELTITSVSEAKVSDGSTLQYLGDSTGVACWNFEGNANSNPTTYNLSGTYVATGSGVIGNNSATLTNQLTLASGSLPSCLTTTSSPYTWSLWFNTDTDLDSKTIIGFNEATPGWTPYGLAITLHSNKRVRVWQNNSIILDSGIDAYKLNTWVNIVYVENKTLGRQLYINGVLVNSSATSLTFGYSGYVLYFGGSLSGYTYTKKLDTVRLYNKACTQAEATKFYQESFTKYTLSTFTPALTNNPSSAYTSTNSTAIYASATAGAGKVFGVDLATTTSSVVLTHNTAGLLANGDVVSMNSGTSGANQNVSFASVVQSGAGPYTYTCTTPTPSLVQVPTTAVKGSLVTPTLSGFTRATDTITFDYVKTTLPDGTRSISQEVSGGVADVISTIGNTELYSS
jgi:hypothetical protein